MYDKLYNRGKMFLRKRFIKYDNISRTYALLDTGDHGVPTMNSHVHLLKENVKDPKGGRVYFRRTLIGPSVYSYEVYVTDANGSVVYSSQFDLDSRFGLSDYLEKQNTFAVVAKRGSKNPGSSDVDNSQYMLNVFNKVEDSKPFMSLPLDGGEVGFTNQILDAVDKGQSDSPTYLLLKSSKTPSASHKLIRIDGTGQELDEPLRSAIYFYNKSAYLNVGDRVCWIQYPNEGDYVTLNVGDIGPDGKVNILYSKDLIPYSPDSIKLKLINGGEQKVDDYIKQQYIPNIDDFLSKKSDNLIVKDMGYKLYMLGSGTNREFKDIPTDNASYAKVLTTDNGKGFYLLLKRVEMNKIELYRLFNYDGDVYKIPVSIPDKFMPKDQPIYSKEVDKSIEDFIKENENNHLNIAFQHSKSNKVCIVKFKGNFSDLDNSSKFTALKNSYDKILYAPIQLSSIDRVHKLLVGVDNNSKRQQLFDINGNILLKADNGKITVTKDSLTDGIVKVESNGNTEEYHIRMQGDKPICVTPAGESVDAVSDEKSNSEQTKPEQTRKMHFHIPEP